MALAGRPKRGVPEGLWIRCPSCKATIFRKEVEDRLNVCPECDYHFHQSARDRIRHLLDAARNGKAMVGPCLQGAEDEERQRTLHEFAGARLSHRCLM